MVITGKGEESTSPATRLDTVVKYLDSNSYHTAPPVPHVRWPSPACTEQPACAECAGRATSQNPVHWHAVPRQRVVVRSRWVKANQAPLSKAPVLTTNPWTLPRTVDPKTKGIGPDLVRGLESQRCTQACKSASTTAFVSRFSAHDALAAALVHVPAVQA